MTMTGAYDARLVALSVLIAILASYTALDLAGRVTAARGHMRLTWLSGGALAMGLGIWSMHFVGMLAFHLAAPVSYDVPTVLLSLVVAIGVAGVALFVASRRTLCPRAWLGGGALMGLGIGAMHYSGMAALRMPLTLRYAPVPFALSLAIAIGASLAALGIAFRLRTGGRRWLTAGSAVVMGAAIAGMHYTGMVAAVFTMGATGGGAMARAARGAGTAPLAAAIALATLVVLGFALLASLVDQRLTAQAAEADALRRSEERLRALGDQLREQGAELRRQLDFTRTITDSLGDGVCAFDRDGRLTVMNPAAERLLGVRAAGLHGEPCQDVIRVHRADGTRVPTDDAPLAHVTREGRTVRGDGEALARPDGALVPVAYTASPILTDGTVTGAVVIVQDISARKRDEERLRLLESVVVHANDAVMITRVTGGGDASARHAIVYANDALARLTGYGTDALVGQTPELLFGARPDPAVAEMIRATVGKRRAARLEVPLRHTDGQDVWVEASLTSVADAQGAATHLVWVQRDITEGRRLREELRRQATHDALTGLANRALLHDRVERAMQRGARAGTRCALLFLDLDDFKTVNDSLGHAAGDALLQAVGTRLGACARPEDTVARLGGDEFAVLLEEGDTATATGVAARIAEALGRPLTVAGREVAPATSIGIALNRDGQDADGLLRDADAAMYVAKRGGKGRCALFEEGLHAAALDRLDLTADLARAVAAGEIAVHYQPIVALEGAITRVEALARWDHPTRGPISPATFIPLAEEGGLIVALDALVLRRACVQARAWAEAGLPAPRIAVNLSGRALSSPRVVETVAAALVEGGVAPGQLEMELTESVAVGEGAETRAVLESIRALGVGLALDDFGTGYSILRRLHWLPFTTLKIDQSFIREMATTGGADLVRMMIGIGHSLGLAVVAEGVETLEQARWLREWGCAYAQGYAFSRPVEADGIAWLLRLQDADANRAVVPVGERLRPLLGELERLTGLESTYVTRIDWERDEQEITVAHNASALVVPEGLRVTWSDSLCRRALDGGPRYTADVPSTYPESGAARELGLRTYVSVPVVGSEQEVVGTLCGASRAVVELSESTLAVMERVGVQIADELARRAA